jgi:hypothetical protein
MMALGDRALEQRTFLLKGGTAIIGTFRRSRAAGIHRSPPGTNRCWPAPSRRSAFDFLKEREDVASNKKRERRVWDGEKRGEDYERNRFP